jgi:hypothetical protein
MNQNIYNKPLKVCSVNPITGYNRDGYCNPDENDDGKHLVCAKMDKQFLDFTASKGNDLRSVVKEGQNWCLCEDRYHESLLEGKQPIVIKESTHKNTKSTVKEKLIENFSNCKNKENYILYFIFLLPVLIFIIIFIKSKSGRRIYKNIFLGNKKYNFLF